MFNTGTLYIYLMYYSTMYDIHSIPVEYIQYLYETAKRLEWRVERIVPFFLYVYVLIT